MKHSLIFLLMNISNTSEVGQDFLDSSSIISSESDGMSSITTRTRKYSSSRRAIKRGLKNFKSKRGGSRIISEKLTKEEELHALKLRVVKYTNDFILNAFKSRRSALVKILIEKGHILFNIKADTIAKIKYHVFYGAIEDRNREFTQELVFNDQNSLLDLQTGLYSLFPVEPDKPREMDYSKFVQLIDNIEKNMRMPENAINILKKYPKNTNPPCGESTCRKCEKIFHPKKANTTPVNDFLNVQAFMRAYKRPPELGIINKVIGGNFANLTIDVIENIKDATLGNMTNGEDYSVPESVIFDYNKSARERNEALMSVNLDEISKTDIIRVEKIVKTCCDVVKYEELRKYVNDAVIPKIDMFLTSHFLTAKKEGYCPGSFFVVFEDREGKEFKTPLVTIYDMVSDEEMYRFRIFPSEYGAISFSNFWAVMYFIMGFLSLLVCGMVVFLIIKERRYQINLLEENSMTRTGEESQTRKVDKHY